MDTEFDKLIPEDRNAKIWRYLDLPKFLYLLDRGCLYFARADRLGDPFEGSITPGSIAAFGKSSDDEWVERMRQFTHRLREWSYISCWHIAEFESAALWRIYSSSPGGIAIQSRLEQLLHIVPERIERRGDCIFSQDVSVVHYIDYAAQNPDMNSSIGPLICKRSSFRHENEVRAILQFIPDTPSPRPDQPNGRAIDLSAPAGPPGQEVPVDIASFIENVFVEPTSADWFFDIVKNLVRRYGFDIPCQRSLLTIDPFF